MKTIRISGGLGNQLFQYVFGLYINKRLNEQVEYDIQTHIMSYLDRDYTLGKLISNVPLAQRVIPFSLSYRLKRKLSLILPWLNRRYFVENKEHQVITDEHIRRVSYFDGYWQCYHYFYYVKDILMQQLENNIDACKKKNLGRIITSDKFTSVSIHIRRGDYLSTKTNKRFNILNKEYYFKAINYFRSNLKTGDIKFFVFSDDPEWCRIEFSGNDFVIVEKNSPEDDILYMSLCNHHIIANSTFSLWASFLNCSEKRIVIAPQHWYNVDLNIDTSYFIPSDYVLL